MGAKSFHSAYSPKTPVAVGDLACCYLGEGTVVGEVKEIKSSRRRKYVIFKEHPDKSYLLSKTVRLPVINEFVRHVQTGKWYKVQSLGVHGTLALLPVLKNLPESQGTPAAEKSAAGDADKNSGDKSAAGDADKNSGDKSAAGDADKNSGDKSAAGDADKNSGNESAAARGVDASAEAVAARKLFHSSEENVEV